LAATFWAGGIGRKPSQEYGVGPGDVFLFFGLFRSVEKVGSQWHYVRSSQPRHIIFGWLQIAQRIAVAEWPRNDRWALYHPHFARPMANNVIYLAERHLTLPSINHIGVSGAGVFNSFSKELQLTAPDASSPSRWLLPGWFNPNGRDSALSYHGNPSRWAKDQFWD